MRWFVLWIAGAVTASVGFLMLALPSILEAARAAAEPTPFAPQIPYALLLAGVAGMVVGVIGVWRSLLRPERLPRNAAGCSEGSARLVVPVVQLLDQPGIRWRDVLLCGDGCGSRRDWLGAHPRFRAKADVRSRGLLVEVGWRLLEPVFLQRTLRHNLP